MPEHTFIVPPFLVTSGAHYSDYKRAVNVLKSILGPVIFSSENNVISFVDRFNMKNYADIRGLNVLRNDTCHSTHDRWLLYVLTFRSSYQGYD